jgi:hypothetical protein
VKLAVGHIQFGVCLFDGCDQVAHSLGGGASRPFPWILFQLACFDFYQVSLIMTGRPIHACRST